MSQRMTAAEVVQRLREESMHFRRDENDRLELGLATAYMIAADLVEHHLTPQVLDEPNEDGWYYVEGLGVRLVLRVGRDFETFPLREPVKGRRAAKVPPGPFAGEGGELRRNRTRNHATGRR